MLLPFLTATDAAQSEASLSQLISEQTESTIREIIINGRIHYLWRAVDQDGDVLDILVQGRRDKKAAKKFFRKLLKGMRYVPRLIITDKLKSYSAAKAEVLPGVEHCQQKYQNNRAENSHQPTQVAGACDETVQISRPRAAFSLCLRNHFLTLSSGETCVSSQRLPRGDEIEICRLGRGDLRRADHELIIAKRQFILPESLRLFLLALS